jgi:hypothetical protein
MVSDLSYHGGVVPWGAINGLTIGTTFGTVSGLLTAIGLILSSYGEHIHVKVIVIILLSLAFSNSLSDAMGIYYTSYLVDRDLKKAIREALKTLAVNALIPFAFAIIFIITHTLKLGSYINIGIGFLVFNIVNMALFEGNWQIQLLNNIVFIIIIWGNYIIGSKIAKLT